MTHRRAALLFSTLLASSTGLAEEAKTTPASSTGSAAWDAVPEEPAAAPLEFGLSFVRRPTLRLNHTLGAQYGPLGVQYELDAKLRWDLFPGGGGLLSEHINILDLSVFVTARAAMLKEFVMARPSRPRRHRESRLPRTPWPGLRDRVARSRWRLEAGGARHDR